MKRSLITLAVFLAITLLLLAAPSSLESSSDDEEGQNLQEFSGDQSFNGYAGSPDGGSEPSTVSNDIVLGGGADTITFSLSWTDDEPNSEPDVFRLRVKGGGVSEDKASSTSPLTITVEGNELEAEWTVDVILEETGTVPGGITGRNPFLSTPDEGNDWNLEVSFSGKRAGKASAIDFSVTDVDGKTFKLSEHLGKVVIIDLNMRCPPCNDQVKELIPVDKEYDNDVVLITLDTTGEGNEVVKAYKEEMGATWIFARDTDSVVQKLQMTTMRKLVIIDPDGDVVFADDSVISSGDLIDKTDDALTGVASAISLGSMGVLGIAFLMGMSAFIAPCALPLLPGFLINHSAERSLETSKDDHNIESFASGASIGMGAALFYVLIGLLIAVFGAAIASVLPVFGFIMAVIVIIVGVMFFMGKHPSLSVVTYRVRKMLGLKDGQGEIVRKVADVIVEKEHKELFTYGVGYGAASSACHGALLVTIILMTAAGGIIAGIQAVMLWALGMLLAFVIVFGLLTRVMEISGITKWLMCHMSTVNKITGALSITAGVLIIIYFI